MDATRGSATAIPHDDSGTAIDHAKLRSWRRWLRRAEPTLLTAAVVLLVCAYCFTPALENRGRLAFWWSPVVFYVRAFQFPAACVGVIWGLSLLIRSRRSLAGGVVAVSLLAMIPELWAQTPISKVASAEGIKLRLMSVNQFRPNYDTTRTQNLIAQEKPDVIALQEYTLEHDKQLSAALAHAYPFSIRFPYPKTNGLAVYSRFPLQLEREPSMLFGAGRMMSVKVSVGGREVMVYNVHPTSPGKPARIADNRRETVQLINALKGEQRPAFVIGDCNFPLNSQQMQAFRDIGFHPADDFTGPGFRWTWSPVRNGPPVTRIDHVILSKHFSVERNEVGPGIGSDHRPIFVDLFLHAAE